MVARLVPPDSAFIEAWTNASSVEECAAALGITKRLATGYASQLRRRGHQLKKFGVFNLVAICAHCHKEFSTFPSLIKGGKGKYCSRKCLLPHIGDLVKRHGESKTRLHEIWCHMKTRCMCETSPAYPYYGGRGVSVCQEWQDSYEAFRDWSLANGYSDSLEIDRKNTNGHYEPSNCRWATRTEQMRNTRKRSSAKTSKYKGVSQECGATKWKLQVCVPGKPIYRGLFKTEVEAAQEYDRIAKLEFGEFAHLNFPED